ncbi:unnamed protein product [Gongylonema pulchrum]|uniref:Uncharacterized protein n=1 Tax=Gongylonema pulchrum TaxID=637853 RepID=A0A183EAR6_9BILA|nr:unnamed protein product [Gongylonema pulchrum]
MSEAKLPAQQQLPEREESGKSGEHPPPSSSSSASSSRVEKRTLSSASSRSLPHADNGETAALEAAAAAASVASYVESASSANEAEINKIEMMELGGVQAMAQAHSLVSTAVGGVSGSQVSMPAGVVVGANPMRPTFTTHANGDSSSSDYVSFYSFQRLLPTQLLLFSTIYHRAVAAKHVFSPNILHGLKF